jgi:hypothetical protein
LAQVHHTIDFRVIWVLVVVGLVLMNISGVVPDPVMPGEGLMGTGRGCRIQIAMKSRGINACQWQVTVTLLRSLLLGALWEVSGRVGWSGWVW